MNAQVRKMMDACPSYMVAEWALPALINGDYTGIIPLDAPESTGEAAMVAQFDEDVVQGRSIIVDEEEDGLNVVLTSIYPEADIAALKAKGIPAVQCPAQTKGITCKECRLCSRDRESVVLFEVHGQSKGKARRVIQIKRAQH